MVCEKRYISIKRGSKSVVLKCLMLQCVKWHTDISGERERERERESKGHIRRKRERESKGHIKGLHSKLISRYSHVSACHSKDTIPLYPGLGVMHGDALFLFLIVHSPSLCVSVCLWVCGCGQRGCRARRSGALLSVRCGSSTLSPGSAMLLTLLSMSVRLLSLSSLLFPFSALSSPLSILHLL